MPFSEWKLVAWRHSANLWYRGVQKRFLSLQEDSPNLYLVAFGSPVAPNLARSPILIVNLHQGSNREASSSALNSILRRQMYLKFVHYIVGGYELSNSDLDLDIP